MFINQKYTIVNENKASPKTICFVRLMSEDLGLNNGPAFASSALPG
jgi:hypothetical protein